MAERGGYDSGGPASPWCHRFAVALAGCVVGLIAAGALVSSKGAGLAVPDWPLSYGTLNPPRWWEIENVRAEHGHRLLAGTVGLLTVALAVWVSRVEPRKWVRRLAWLAVGTVLVQAILGGITVLWFLPTVVSVAHAAVAELFLCLVVTLAVVTSPWWYRMGTRAPLPDSPRLFPLAAATTLAIYLQILLGAVVRHRGAGLAIPDFPLAFGRLWPPEFDFAIGVHYAHRLGALVVCLLVAGTLVQVFRSPGREIRLLLPALFMGILVGVQIALGGAVVLTGRAVLPNTLHVATGATLLATSLGLSLAAWRRRPAPSLVRGRFQLAEGGPVPRKVTP